MPDGDETKCSQTECSRPVYARTVCSKHYQALRTKGQLPKSVATQRSCVSCGSLLEHRVSARAQFCSPKCKDDHRTAQLRASRHELAADRGCLFCGKSIPAEKSARTQCCSSECSWRYQNKVKSDARWAAKLAEREPCRRCGATIPDSKRSNAVYCTRKCMTEDVSERNYDSERARDLNRQYLYGLTSAQVEAMLMDQGARCAICGTTEWPGRGNSPHVDHCHETNRIRGLLCHDCNVGLGHFKDDPNRLAAAITYLAKHAPATT